MFKMNSTLTFIIYCCLSYICKKGFVCQLFQNKQYDRKGVGYNSALENNNMAVTPMTSRLECGSYCTEKNCSSFIYESANDMCTMYSVYMVGDGHIMDNYYVTNGAVETVVVVGTCQSVEYSSSFTNVALYKPVTMSSVFDVRSDGPIMVDGLRDGFNPCAHTAFESNPYMIVDLTNNYNVHSLYLLNRLDCCGDRLFNLKIELGKTSSAMTEYVYHDGVVGNECTFVLDHITESRYIRLSVVGETYVTVCELEVYSLT